MSLNEILWYALAIYGGMVVFGSIITGVWAACHAIRKRLKRDA